MEDDAYEAAVASEGDNASFSVDRDGLLRDFLERFALAVDTPSKRAIVASALLPGSSEALYYSGLCDLHDVQTLLNENTQENDVLAWERLEDKKKALESTVVDLQTRYCHKKAARLQQRLLLLQMELQKRLNKPKEDFQRGVFVVEVLEGGQTCRAILRKGFLRHVERITIEGHELLVLNERGEMVRDARALVLNLKSGNSKAQPGRYYNADRSGKILIPFRHRSAANDQYAIVFCHNDFGFFQRSFAYLTEKLELCADMHIDYEQLVPGAKAQLVARPYLLVGETRQEVSFFDTLTQVTMTVKFAKAESEAGGSEEVQAFSGIQHFIESGCSFEIPMDADSFTVTLSARASKTDQSGSSVGDAKYAPPLLSCTKSFQVTRVMKSAGIASLHLTRRPTPSSSTPGYILMVLGHNGEPVPNVEVAVACEHVCFVNKITATLQSSLSGEIDLGQLIGVQKISATLPKHHELGEWDWELPNFCFYQPQNIYCSVGEVIEIPIAPVFRDQMLSWHSHNL
uniref:Uncharacterized protein n=1 Tax=Globisporangium ultimum (strain ATCC 200006 / CBS 805.95 / DAOM BR144) TaxID=431595 RepID=K3X8M8_GLOUD